MIKVMVRQAHHDNTSIVILKELVEGNVILKLVEGYCLWIAIIQLNVLNTQVSKLTY
jgi:expansin (peptidoglycan-binding protein)